MLRRAVSLALEGGGAKGFLYTGTLRALQERRKDLKVANVVGSSAGALTALLIGMDVPYKEVEAIVTGTSPLGSIEGIQDEIPLEKRRADFNKHYSYIDDAVDEAADDHLSFFKEKAFDWYVWPAFEAQMRKVGGQITQNYGINDDLFLYQVLLNAQVAYGQAMVDLLQNVLEQYAGYKDITLGGFKEKFGVNLVVTGSDITSQILRVFSAKTAPDLPVKFACRMSSGIPYFFPVMYWQPGWGKYLGKDITMNRFVDGGMLLNLPTSILASSKPFQRKYIGQQVDSENVVSFLLDEHPDAKKLKANSKVPKTPQFKQYTSNQTVELKDDYLAAVRKDKNFNNLDEKKPEDNSFKSIAKSVPGLLLLQQLGFTIYSTNENFPQEAYSEDTLKLNAENIGTVNFGLEGVNHNDRMEEAYKASKKFLAEQFK